MNEVKCKIKDCPSVYRTEETLAVGATFICSGRGADGYPIPGHTRRELVEAAGRTYDRKKDNADIAIAFQSVQFDPELAGRKKKVELKTENKGVE